MRVFTRLFVAIFWLGCCVLRLSAGDSQPSRTPDVSPASAISGESESSGVPLIGKCAVRANQGNLQKREVIHCGKELPTE